MQYMLLIYADEQAWTEAEREQCYGESTQLAHQLKSKGQYLAAAPLQPVSTATSVRMRNDKRLVTDGPFAETREQLGGYFLVDAKDLDEAIGIAARIPGARKGTVEIRPVMEIAGLPTNYNPRFTPIGSSARPTRWRPRMRPTRSSSSPTARRASSRVRPRSSPDTPSGWNFTARMDQP